MPIQLRNTLSSLIRSFKKQKRPKVKQTSPYQNIYHCCTQKTASQWFKAVFNDYIFYKYTGLEIYSFEQIVPHFQDASFNGPLPLNTLGTPFYLDYSSYLSLPKPDRYKTFFILRDPRDIVVSWYFSTRYSHPPIGGIPQQRIELENMDLQKGLMYGIDYLMEYGLFDGQRSWMQIDKENDNVMIFRYEDLSQDNLKFLINLFNFLKVDIPEKDLLTLHKHYRFEALSNGRKHGVEDQKSHYRKGIAGDWKLYFHESTKEYFNNITKDLLSVLGYQ